MIYYSLHKYPYIRLLIPWMAGVFCGDRFFDERDDSSICFSLLGLLVLLTIGCYFLRRHSLRWCFGVCVAALCFVGGWTAVGWQLERAVYEFPEEEAVYRVRLTELPEAKERSYLCRVILKERIDSATAYPIERPALLYLAKDSSVMRLCGREELLVSSRISPPKNGGNFCEFDYERYLLRKGICGTGYVASGHWKRLPFSASPSLRQKSDAYREKLIGLFQRLGFEGDELAVLSALTVGDKTDLSESIEESFSISGASHVLALSGLHIGLLYALFSYLFKWVAVRGRWGRLVRSLIVLSLLGAFAFFTGLFPSVVRSVCMFSVLAIADVCGRQSISMNTVAVVAWWMLLICPVWMFDVGFQLSFLAVAAILLVQPLLYRLWPVKNWIGKRVWGLITVSVAAQLGTAPLVLLYFSRFSTHFLLTNLIVVPLTTLILYVAVLMLLLTPFSFLQAIVACICDMMLKFLNAFVRWVERLPYSSVDDVWLYQWEVAGIYLFILLLLYYISKKRFRPLLACLCCLLLVVAGHAAAIWTNRPQRSVVFYNVNNCSAVHFIDSDGSSWLNYRDSLTDGKSLRRVAANYWRKLRLAPPVEVKGDVRERSFFRDRQILSYQGCRVGMVTDNRWRNKAASTPLFLHYLYVCRGYDGNMEELMRVFQTSCVVLDASLPAYRKRVLAEECRRKGLRAISLSDEGSVRFLL